MDKMIVWFTSNNKKDLRNQFHTLANTNKEAIDNLKKFTDSEVKIYGISQYKGDDLFINNKFF